MEENIYKKLIHNMSSPFLLGKNNDIINNKNDSINHNHKNIKKEEINQKSYNNENKDLIIGNNYIKSKDDKTINTNLLNQKIVREKQINNDILNDNDDNNDNENKEKKYSKSS